MRAFSLSMLIGLILISCKIENEEVIPASEKMVANILNAIENSSLDKNVMIISGVNDSAINYTIRDGWESAWDDTNHLKVMEPGDEVYKGTGYGFASRVKDQVDSGKCVKVYKDGKEYVAEGIFCF